MNISRVPAYNAELVPLRKGGASSRTKLVFVYPMLFDRYLQTVAFNTVTKDSNNVVDLIRAFHTITVLKEIVVSNMLNLVTLASTLDRAPQKEQTADRLIGRLLRNEGYAYQSQDTTTQDSVPKVDPYFLQQKINQKMEEVRNIIKSDPRYRTLMPFIEIITLQNLMDLPVIVGTMPKLCETKSLLSLLVVAIGMRKPLTKMDTVRAAIREITREEMRGSSSDIYSLLNYSAGSINNSNIIPVNSLPGGQQTAIDRYSTLANTEPNPRFRNAYQNRVDELESRNAFRNVRDLDMSDLKLLEINFLFCLDPSMMLTKLGLSSEAGQMSSVMRRVNPQVELMFSRTQQQFYDFLAGTAEAILYSLNSIFGPRNSASPSWNRDYSSIKSAFLSKLAADFSNKFSDAYLSQFESMLNDRTLESAGDTVRMFKDGCTDSQENFISSLNDFNNSFNSKMLNPSFQLNDLRVFTKVLEQYKQKMEAITTKYQLRFTKFFGSSEASSLCAALNFVVSDAVATFMAPYQVTRSFQNNQELTARYYYIVNNFEERYFDLYFNSVTTAVQKIFYGIALSIFHMNFCRFMDVIDLELNVAQNDVLSLPNYSLAIPLEVANLLFTFLSKRDWKKVINSGFGANPLQVSNPKQVVKQLGQALGIPNFYVFDTKNGELYYRLQFLGGRDVEKMKLSALNTYVAEHIRKPEVAQIY